MGQEEREAVACVRLSSAVEGRPETTPPEMTRDDPRWPARDFSEIKRLQDDDTPPLSRAPRLARAARRRGQQRETEGWCVAGARLEQRMANVGEAARALLAGR